MKITIGADHRGFDFKKNIISILSALGHEVIDAGTNNSEESCDYPKIAFAVASAVADGQAERGMLVCLSGIGQAIAANKVNGAYAALCHNVESAKFSRQHNNSNILVIGAKFVVRDELEEIIEAWLATPFEGGRHERRINQIKEIEEKKTIS